MKGKNLGFSLIEMAIVMVILGIMATVLVPPFVSSVKYEKRAENKDALNALKLTIIGYVKANDGVLPGSSDSLNGTGLPTKDIWGRSYEYKKGVNGSVCNPESIEDFELTDNTTVENIAFALASHSRLNGDDENAQYSSAGWDFNGADDDDIYEYVTLSQLKYLVCSNSSGDSTDKLVLYDDSFENDLLMQNATFKYSSLNWNVGSGALEVDGYDYFVVGDHDWGNYTVSVDVRMDEDVMSASGVRGGVALLYRADLGGYVPIGYGFQIDPSLGDKFALRQYNSNSQDLLWSTKYTDSDWVDAHGVFDVSEWHTMTVVVSGNDHTLYIDGIELFNTTGELPTYTDDTDPIYSSGQVGLRFWGDYSATFDNLKVTEN